MDRRGGGLGVRVSLRLQLLGLGLLTLILPWAGYRYVQILEGALRSGLELALSASADTIAAALAARELRPAPISAARTPANTIYGAPLDAAPVIDGYSSDWPLDDLVPRTLGSGGRFWTGVHERYVYAFFAAEDESVVYQNAPTRLPHGDRAVVLLGAVDTPWLLFHTSAPGIVRPQLTQAPEFRPGGRVESRALGYWRERPGGYDLEVRLPIDLVNGRLGAALIDVDPAGGDGPRDEEPRYAVALQSSWRGGREPSAEELLIRPADLNAVAERFEQPGKRLRIVDRDGWVLFDGGAIDPVDSDADLVPSGLAQRFLRLILARGDPAYTALENPRGYLRDPDLRAELGGGAAVRWYARAGGASAVVVAMVPIIAADDTMGAVILEQGSDAILTLTNEALVRLMSFTLLACLLVAAGLLSYATILSLRIRGLARAADGALSPEGDIEPALPGRLARDEIGDLARSFTALLKRLRDHTQYLATLRAKLSHELRTPLAVVSTSLENIEREPHEAQLAPYLSRLREGVDRIDTILNAMSEATVLEHAITDTAPQIFELEPVVRGCVLGYEDVYREHSFDFRSDIGPARISGSAELVAQMLDKLVDNAVSFSPARSTIDIGLAAEERGIRLSVSNPGPRLPVDMRASLFESLVSLREPGSQRGHLGLGLYIVALVAAFHDGRVSADDLPDGRGVTFSVVFPHLAAA
jgi:dedicated sortase system histidine kinase